MDAAARFRQAVRGLGLPQGAAERRYDAFFSATVDGGRLRSRVPRAAELDEWLAPRADDTRLGNSAGEGASLLPFTKPDPAAPRPGLVSLVGAGPGDPGLLTLRARRRLLAAEAVVYDRLAAPALPCDLGPEVELHCVGKEAGHHPVPQEINALVRLALAGKRPSASWAVTHSPRMGSEEAPCAASAFLTRSSWGHGRHRRRRHADRSSPRRGRPTPITAHESSKGCGPQVLGLPGTRSHAMLVGYMGVANYLMS
jgi:hypothetical protein